MNQNTKNNRVFQRFLGILILTGIAMLTMGCKNSTNGTKTVTADISVPAITAVANPMQFGPVSAYTGWDDNFPHSDVTYTLILSQGGSAKVTVNSTTVTTISASGQANGMYTLSQTFYYNGKSVGSRSTGIEVLSNVFAGLFASEADEFTPGSFSALTLSLSKKL